MELVLALVFWLYWLAFAFAVGAIASRRGRSGVGYFFLSIFMSPLFGALLALGLPPLKDPMGEDLPTRLSHLRCPACRELVRSEATKCAHCGIALIPGGQRNT